MISAEDAEFEEATLEACVPRGQGMMLHGINPLLFGPNWNGKLVEQEVQK